MAYRLLFLFVEGNDDQLFFEKVVLPPLENQGYHVQIYQYARETRHKVNDFIRSINAMPMADYLFFADYDERAPCISARVATLIQTYASLERAKVRIVVRELEGWYLAGIDDEVSRGLKIQVFSDTDELTKEKFDVLSPRKFQTNRIDFMQELLKHFDFAIARRKNGSFEYFAEKCNL
jgi:hypothetical protein